MYACTHAASRGEDNLRSQFLPFAVWDSWKELKLSVPAACCSPKNFRVQKFQDCFPCQMSVKASYWHSFNFICLFV